MEALQTMREHHFHTRPIPIPFGSCTFSRSRSYKMAEFARLHDIFDSRLSANTSEQIQPQCGWLSPSTARFFASRHTTKQTSLYSHVTTEKLQAKLLIFSPTITTNIAIFVTYRCIFNELDVRELRTCNIG